MIHHLQRSTWHWQCVLIWSDNLKLVYNLQLPHITSKLLMYNLQLPHGRLLDRHGCGDHGSSSGYGQDGQE